MGSLYFGVDHDPGRHPLLKDGAAKVFLINPDYAADFVLDGIKSIGTFDDLSMAGKKFASLLFDYKVEFVKSLKIIRNPGNDTKQIEIEIDSEKIGLSDLGNDIEVVTRIIAAMDIADLADFLSPEFSFEYIMDASPEDLLPVEKLSPSNVIQMPFV